MNASTATANGKMTAEKFIKAVVIGAILILGADFLFRRQEVSPPASIGDRFIYRVHRLSLETDVYERETGRYIFSFNMDSGPGPKKIEKKTDGTWAIEFGAGH